MRNLNNTWIMSTDFLDPMLVRKAREDEMSYVKSYQVYEKVPIEQCLRDTGKRPVGVRWVDTNCGTDEKPEI